MPRYLWAHIVTVACLAGQIYGATEIYAAAKEDSVSDETPKSAVKKKNRKKEALKKESDSSQAHVAEEPFTISEEDRDIDIVEETPEESKSSVSPVLPEKINTQPESNITIYRNGTALCTKKIRADLKTGGQKIVSSSVPQTLQQDSVMATLDVSDDHVHMLSQYVSAKKNNLTLMMHSDYDQVKIVTLNYLFTGLDWDIFYTGMLSSDQKTLVLHGWIELINHCGVDLKQAQVLFDGSTTTLTPEGMTVLTGDKMAFHYLVPSVLSLPKEKKTSLLFLQSKPITLVENLTLNIGEEFLKELNHQVHHPAVQRVLEFKNDASTLNMTLPEGKMILYHMQDNQLDRLLGSTTLLETRLGESVFIRAGQDPSHLGLLCDVEQTEYKKNSNKSYDMGYSVRIQNKGDVVANLKIDLPLKNYTWTIVRSSHEYKVASQDQGVYWDMDVPPKGMIEVKYRLKLEEKQGR